ncbi:hypothetical protein [Aestuariispira ectoiniformans]|uniref:hypothetical protein n=1 Tax=Aestuariispira ectoiniformans TaxID=2775080 RepID=UPI00223BBAC4|nr:hypothetical protein [Aestuariispira ectoiniformans]
MQGIKALVIFMGVLIVAGMVALVYGMISQVGKLSDKDTSASKTVISTGETQPTKTRTFGTMSAPLPRGAEILETDISGMVMTLRYRTQDGVQEILVLDLGAGESLGTVKLQPVGGAE